MEPQTSSSKIVGLPRPAALGGGLLLLLIAVFVVGYVVGHRPVGALNQQVEQVDADLEQSRARIGQLEARLQANRALTLVYESMLDVDARNFGTANERLDEAATVLAGIDPDAIGPAAEELEILRQELATLDVRVAGDLAQQRVVLTGLAQRLGQVLGR